MSVRDWLVWVAATTALVVAAVCAPGLAVAGLFVIGTVWLFRAARAHQ